MTVVAPNSKEKDQVKPISNGNIPHEDKKNNVNFQLTVPSKNARLSISNMARIKMLVMSVTKRIKERRCSGKVLKALIVVTLICFGLGLLTLEILAIINFYTLDNADTLIKRFYTGFWFGSITSIVGFTGLLLECKSAPWLFSMLLPMVMLLQVSSAICFIFYLSELSLILKNNEVLSANCALCHQINIAKTATGTIVTFIILLSGLFYFLKLTNCHRGGCKRHNSNADIKKGQSEQESGKNDKVEENEERLEQVIDNREDDDDYESYDDYSGDSYISSEENQ